MAAFTLIEILVVVAIIALLIAILLPSLSRARKQAQNVACLSNLHQFGTAFYMYGQDYRQKPPPNRQFGGTAPDYKDSDWWYYKHMVPKYIRSEKLSLTRSALFGVFSCPGDIKISARSYSMNIFANAYPYRDPVTNQVLHSDAVTSTTGGLNFNPFSIKLANRYILLADAFPIYSAGTVAPGYLATSNIIGTDGDSPFQKFRQVAQTGFPSLRGYIDFTKHLDRGSFLLADLHVETLARTVLVDERGSLSRLKVWWSPNDQKLNQ